MSRSAHHSRLIPVLFALGAATARAAGAAEALTLESIFSPDTAVRIEFGGTPIQGLLWSPDGSWFLKPQTDGDAFRPPLVEELGTGRNRPLFDFQRMVTQLGGLADFPEQDASDLLVDDVQLSPLQDALLIERANDLFYYSIADGRGRRLTNTPEAEEVPRFSPDGSRVAFVREHNLHVVETATSRETVLTVDGTPDLLNGKLDWVYQEELYGRGDFQGFWWSPDSTHLAFLQLDESPVSRFTLVDHLPTRSRTEVVHYPKAGDPNPLVRLGVIAAKGGEVTWVDTSDYQASEPLIVRVEWTPDSRHVVFHLQDRQQKWLDLLRADRDSSSPVRILHESSPAFVDRDLTGRTFWLQDGSFLWLSARSGYHHLYHFEPNGTIRRRLTEGDWEVRELYGCDETTGWIYFAASERSPIEIHLYRVRLDGSGFARLTEHPGTHRGLFDRTFSHYFDTWSDIENPPRVDLHQADGTKVRTVDANRVEALERLSLPKVEFLQVPSPDGFVFEAALIRPPDFDPERSYPVFQHNYGGPHSQTVRNAWGGSRNLWLRYLAQEGFVVWMCDNRSASAKGIWPTWKAYRQMGVVELADMETCLSWLERQPWADGSRVAIHGGSYGGFMAAFALTHSRSFKVGIAFAPVTDWRLYDSIYTERYMQLPQENPEGYSTTSVVEAAGQLHGELLLIHGTMDDNVHLQNSLQLADALQRAGKDFQFMLYPNSRHGVRDRSQIYHLYRLKTRFLREKL